MSISARYVIDERRSLGAKIASSLRAGPARHSAALSASPGLLRRAAFCAALLVFFAGDPGMAEQASEDNTTRLRLLAPTASEAGDPARIQLQLPPLPERYEIELRLAGDDKIFRADDVEFPPPEILKQARAVRNPQLEIYAADDELTEGAEWIRIEAWIRGAAQSGAPGEKLLGSAVIRLIDNDPDPAFGRLAWYRWLKGYPYDFGGLGNHAQITGARYFSEGNRAALVFADDDHFVRLTPAADQLRKDEPGALAHYAYLKAPFAQRTVALWIMPRDTQAPRVLYREGDAQNGFSLVLRDAGLFFSTAAAGETATLEAAVDPNEWIHVAAVFDHGRLRLLINGKPWDEARLPALAVGYHPHDAFLSRGPAPEAGAGFTDDYGGFRGMIGDLAIYDLALDEGSAGAVMRAAPISAAELAANPR